jgi:hypothetical protein
LQLDRSTFGDRIGAQAARETLAPPYSYWRGAVMQHDGLMIAKRFDAGYRSYSCRQAIARIF